MRKPNKTASAERLQFVEPMYPRAVQQLPEGKDWLCEVKLDGYRCLAGKGFNRHNAMVKTRQLLYGSVPTTAEACQHLPADTLLDGEISGLDATGRISFNQLQHHRSQAQTILFYAFDVIIHQGRPLIHVPLETRRELLSDMAADLKPHTSLIGLYDTLDTTPSELIPLVKEFGFEGIIAKRKDSCYESGERRCLAQVQGQ